MINSGLQSNKQHPPKPLTESPNLKSPRRMAAKECEYLRSGIAAVIRGVVATASRLRGSDSSCGVISCRVVAVAAVAVDIVVKIVGFVPGSFVVRHDFEDEKSMAA
ncbi:unnamed protein product [Linum trigynum]|uniref:Uncharacterized protein n=1 Tax=Linum trigynum TaxID=586398 RepID=A0AAV2DLH2_9ROSI